MKHKKLNRTKGIYGEKLACKYLEKNNYRIIKKNYKNCFGEIDLIAMEKSEIVFIEVKMRTDKKYGSGFDAINYYKIKHIKNVANVFIKNNKFENYPIRFDAIQIYIIGEKVRLEHVKQII